MLVLSIAFVGFSLLSRHLIQLDLSLSAFSPARPDFLLSTVDFGSFESLIPPRGSAWLGLSILVPHPISLELMLLLKRFSCVDLLLFAFASTSTGSFLSVLGLVDLESTLPPQGASKVGFALLVLGTVLPGPSLSPRSMA